MAEEKRLETAQIFNTDFGAIHMDDEVIASATAITVSGMEGIVNTFNAASEGFIGNMTDNFTGMLGKKSGTKGIRVDFKNDGYYIVINIKVLFGYCIPDLANDIQRKVKMEIEQMTDKKVRSVDIFVQGIDFNNVNEVGMGDQHA